MRSYNSNEKESGIQKIIIKYEKALAVGNILYLEVEEFEKLINYYDEKYQYNKAFKAIENAINQYSYNVVFYIRKAQFLLDRERFEEAEDALDTAAVYAPSEIEIFLTRAELLHQQNKLDQAHQVLQQASFYAGKDDYIEIWMMESFIYESQKNYHAMFVSLKNLLKAQPKHELAYSRMWISVELNQNYQEAIDLHLKLIDKEPYAYWAWYNIGHAYNKINEIDKAIEAYDYAIVIDEKFEYAYKDIIALLLRVELYEKALVYLEDYLLHFDEDAEIYLRFAICYECLNDFNKAYEYLQKAQKIDQLEGRVFYHLGVLMYKQEKYKAALEAFHKAYLIDEKNSKFCVALANSFDHLNDVGNAYHFYEKAVQLQPLDIDLWYNFIEFLIIDENFEEAKIKVEDAMTHLNDANLLYVKAAVLFEAGLRQEGFQVLIEALEERENELEVLYQFSPDLELDAEVQQLIMTYN